MHGTAEQVLGCSKICKVHASMLGICSGHKRASGPIFLSFMSDARYFCHLCQVPAFDLGCLDRALMPPSASPSACTQHTAP